MVLNWNTFTISVSVYAWMHSDTEASTQLLLSYLSDIAESLPFRGQVTAGPLNGAARLWFTFSSREDANDFRAVLEQLYKMGGWLNED